jgi:D-glycero-D-manno-heptose 1,7-bisphosphate phosphatase
MKKKAVFLDRDGIINMERGDYTWKKDDFIFVPEIFDNLNNLQKKGFLLIVISNQGGVAKKLYSLEELDSIMSFMRSEMAQKGVYIHDILFCPHHPDYNGKCICRKPDSVLFEKSLAKYTIDPQQSYMIGDKDRDIKAAEKAGIRSFLTEANQSIKNIVSLIR